MSMAVNAKAHHSSVYWTRFIALYILTVS